jgi:hypothetical protein
MLDDLVFETAEKPTAQSRAFEHHFVVVRNVLLRDLWSRDFLFGRTTIEELLYDAVRSGASNPVRHILQIIRKSGIHRPGLCVYPLHSIGIAGAGVFSAFTHSVVEITLRKAGIVFSPQTNGMTATKDFLQRAAHGFGVKQKLPFDLIDHYRRSRPTKWLERNPLLAVRITSFTGGYYENQAPLTIKLAFATTLLYMISVLERSMPSKEKYSWTSSSGINNWETLDIKHYMLLEAGIRRTRKMQCLCIPMNVDRLTLAQLSEVSANLHPVVWSKVRKKINRLTEALKTVEREYRESLYSGDENRVRNRVFNKLYDALLHFRNSFSRRRVQSESVVNSAIAFETLLMDSYAAPVEKHIHRRLRLVLRGIRGNRALLAAVSDMYDARSDIVHEGRARNDVDMVAIRTAFVNAFLHIAERLPRLPNKSAAPIAELLGYKPPKERTLSVKLPPKLAERTKQLARQHQLKPEKFALSVLRQSYRHIK